jgi:hypothetical protein
MEEVLSLLLDIIVILLSRCESKFGAKDVRRPVINDHDDFIRGPSPQAMNAIVALIG